MHAASTARHLWVTKQRSDVSITERHAGGRNRRGEASSSSLRSGRCRSLSADSWRRVGTRGRGYGDRSAFDAGDRCRAPVSLRPCQRPRQAFGELGERIAERWLRRQGWRVGPAPVPERAPGHRPRRRAGGDGGVRRGQGAAGQAVRRSGGGGQLAQAEGVSSLRVSLDRPAWTAERTPTASTWSAFWSKATGSGSDTCRMRSPFSDSA